MILLKQKLEEESVSFGKTVITYDDFLIIPVKTLQEAKYSYEVNLPIALVVKQQVIR